ncbi:type III-B CRISPR module RAMP protein Cmr6 [Vandammella animalimorsus]|uniref:type III-B CRISPR module RAMP protein Cmr6 n=1 Tax=Vandammella animalimorsus TaxID=2029117 RepID=UPI00325A739E
MSIAAVPAYFSQNFSEASPAMRFGMYLPIWTDRTDQEAEVKDRAKKKSREGQEVEALLKRQGMDATIEQLCQADRKPLPRLWEKNDYASKIAWDKVTLLTYGDLARMHALFTRQNYQAQNTAHTLTLDAIATAPFTTGLGNEHPLENGFAFLTPYGLPYLPGSGIKGVLRQAARELASGEWESDHGWSKDKRYAIQANGQRAELSMLDALFGLESKDGDALHVRGALSFWDAIPQVPGDHLHVEVMTPHQSHYYQQKKDRKTGDSTSPHDSGQPTPICFLTLPPKTQFAFHVQCDLAHLERLAPELAENDQWQKLVTAAFEHAFAWLGFGAKTAVGYGAMQSEQQRQRERQAAAERARQQQEQARAQAAHQLEREAETWEGARLKFNARNGALSAEKNGQTAIATAVDSPKGAELFANLPAPIQQKVKTNQFVKVTARVAKGRLLGVMS